MRKKVIGKPYEGKLHVRFDEGKLVKDQTSEMLTIAEDVTSGHQSPTLHDAEKKFFFKHEVPLIVKIKGWD